VGSKKGALAAFRLIKHGPLDMENCVLSAIHGETAFDESGILLIEGPGTNDFQPSL
jgi:hypothetical protein